MSTTAVRYVSHFGAGVDDGGKGDKNFLGGKGTNVDGMPAIGLPVPPGFTITIEMRTRYYQDGSVLPESPNADVANGIVRIEGVTGKITATRPIRCSSPSARARAFSCQHDGHRPQPWPQ